MPDIPLELKILVIRELSPSHSTLPARKVRDENAAYFRDLRAVCLVWPNTIAIVRKILFEKIALRTHDHDLDASLRNLGQALENDLSLPTFVRTLEFSHQNTNEESFFIPISSRSLFLSFLSFIPQMHKLQFVRLDSMYFYEKTSTQFLDDLGVLKQSSMKRLILSNNTFSISAFNALFNHWHDMEIQQVSVDAISLMPPSSSNIWMLLHLDEATWDWDDEDTWTDWEFDRPRTASSCYVDILKLTLSRAHVSGMLILMDILASREWSPFACVDLLEISVGDSSCSTMTATLVKRLNNLIHRYELSYLSFDLFTVFKGAVGTPLYLAGVKTGDVRLRVNNPFALFRPDEDLFNWYIESLVAVPPYSRLQEFCLQLVVLVPLNEKDLGSQGVWGKLDAALSGENLQLETLALDVFLQSPSNGAKTVGLAQLQTWLMEVCFPQVTTKYFRCKKEAKGGREMSALQFWIGNEQVDA